MIKCGYEYMSNIQPKTYKTETNDTKMNLHYLLILQMVLCCLIFNSPLITSTTLKYISCHVAHGFSAKKWLFPLFTSDPNPTIFLIPQAQKVNQYIGMSNFAYRLSSPNLHSKLSSVEFKFKCELMISRILVALLYGLVKDSTKWFFLA